MRRGTLGLESQDVDARLAQGLGLGDARGAVVTRVFAGSAAAGAGLKPGDVIVAANGQRIDNRDALRNFEGLQAVGGRVALDVLRDGKPLQLAATLREQPKSFAGRRARPAPGRRGVRRAARTAAAVGLCRRAGGVGRARQPRRAERPAVRRRGASRPRSGQFADLPGFRASFTRAPAQLILRVVRGNRPGDLPMR